MKPGKTQRRKVIGLCTCPECREFLTAKGRYGKNFGVVRAESKVDYDLSLIDNDYVHEIASEGKE